MSNFQQFANDLVVDVIKTAFYGENILPIMKIHFPSEPLIDQAVSDSDNSDSHGSIDTNIDWEFEIEVLLTGDKYRKYADQLELDSSILVYFEVQSRLQIDYSYSHETYHQPAEEDINLNSIENVFNSEISVDGEYVELTEENKKFYEEFSKKYEGDTDEDMSEVITNNQKRQLLYLITNPQMR
jgi:hypothetical protein